MEKENLFRFEVKIADMRNTVESLEGLIWEAVVSVCRELRHMGVYFDEWKYLIDYVNFEDIRAGISWWSHMPYPERVGDACKKLTQRDYRSYDSTVYRRKEDFLRFSIDMKRGDQQPKSVKIEIKRGLILGFESYTCKSDRVTILVGYSEMSDKTLESQLKRNVLNILLALENICPNPNGGDLMRKFASELL